jgi:hypothetical protein
VSLLGGRLVKKAPSYYWTRELNMVRQLYDTPSYPYSK